MRKLTFICLATLLLFSCRKDEEGVVDGPSLENLFGDFSVITDITVNQTAVDFSVGEDIHWNGEISKNTDWVIRLTGQTTGAMRTITGDDRIISVTNAIWLGGANNFPGFGLEDVDVEITFPNEENAPVFNYVITVEGLKIDSGTLASSFEDGIGSNWQSFNQAGVAGEIICGDGQAASGDCYYSVSGTVAWDWAIGSVMVVPEPETFDLPNSPSNLFLNMGFKVEDHVGQSFVLFWIDEDEDGDGVWEQGQEDRIIYEYWSETDEWDLISLNYADLKFDEFGEPIDFGGNGLMEPSKVVAINVFFLSNPELGYNQGSFDQLIFTTDGPYLP